MKKTNKIAGVILLALTLSSAARADCNNQELFFSVDQKESWGGLMKTDSGQCTYYHTPETQKGTCYYSIGVNCVKGTETKYGTRWTVNCTALDDPKTVTPPPNPTVTSHSSAIAGPGNGVCAGA